MTLQEAAQKIRDMKLIPFLCRGGTMLAVADKGRVDNHGFHDFGEVWRIVAEGDQWLLIQMSSGYPACYQFKTLEEVVALLERIFLGEPLNIDGWLFPLHRYPYWKESEIRDAYEHARTVLWVTWLEIQNECVLNFKFAFEKMQEDGTYHWMALPEYKFYSIPHVGETDEKLFLRLDLKAIYKVKSLKKDEVMAP
ncbi:MAG: hypothetical protein SFY92_04580 [Verrucomicrobiae bacterium]|nr:hypothetical protein [Verrucomicrobiae bacterium]